MTWQTKGTWPRLPSPLSLVLLLCLLSSALTTVLARPFDDDQPQPSSMEISRRSEPSKEGYDYFNGQKKTEKQEKVVEAFKHAWGAYKKYAWGEDELLPISKTSSEWFGTGLTLVDSLDTMIIMGLKEEYEEAKAWVRDELSFDNDKFISLFEVTIRVLGSLLSSYHLTGDEIMKEKALDLGERLLPAFDTPSKIPFAEVNLANGTARPYTWTNFSVIAEVGTLQLEFRDLSDVTGDERFEEAVDQVAQHIHFLHKYHGLVPMYINPKTGRFTRSKITLGAMADSYYEYLLKQWIQSDQTLDMFKEDFEESYEGAKLKLFEHSQPNHLLFFGELYGRKNLSPKMDHLACFYPGTLALAHHYGLGEDDEYLDSAKGLAETCWQMYDQMPTKLSPEIAYFNTTEGSNEDLIIKPLDRHNLLRPETVETLFYMYRITGDQKYRDQGWTIFQAFEKYTKVADGGYSSISNVLNPQDPEFKDKMESFFLAETLKYFYLLFSDDPDLINLDEWVFNTEAHPLPVFKTSSWV